MPIFRTTRESKSEIPPLLSPPLLESIFELRWELEGDPQAGRLRDPAYPMMYGRLYEKLKKDFPLIEDLPSTQVHHEASPYAVRHRLRKEKDSYPLIQVGPGLVTVNDARGYSWTRFRGWIEKVAGLVKELYPAGAFPLNFIKAELRFVNGVRFDPQLNHPLQFLREMLNTKIEFNPELFASQEISSKPLAVALNVAYPLSSPVGNFALSVGMGQIEGKPALIFQTMIQSVGETAPQNGTSLAAWLKQAHQTASHAFLSMCHGPLLQKMGQSETE
jgi:uncharacterized protein (TIGR04255 family)